LKNNIDKGVLSAAVLVGTLGYFVDIFDLLLFSIVRVPSLRSIGVPESEVLNVGVHLLNMQMTGMLIGGVIWGMLGDRRGRISVLFGSILLYSLANICNSFVHDTHTYALLRFLSGMGLAGELGAAITLVSETLSKETRGYGTTMIASVGVCGALLAAIVGERFEWRTAYQIGGALGMVLLFLRISLNESGMFVSLKSDKKSLSRGNFFALFKTRERFVRYVSCILVGAPTWFVIGVLITFSPELAKVLGVQGQVMASQAVFYSYAGLAVGDLLSGLFSQWVKSRRKALGLFLGMTAVFIIVYANAQGISLVNFYAICFALGIAAGYWAIFITVGAEQFGTNMRATVATTAPNFVRGLAVPITLSFQALKVSLGPLHSALVVGLTTVAVACLALFTLKETFGKSLNFVEYE